MIYKVLIDGKEVFVNKKLTDGRREMDNIAREEIIRHYLEDEGAEEVWILEKDQN